MGTEDEDIDNDNEEIEHIFSVSVDSVCRLGVYAFIHRDLFTINSQRACYMLHDFAD